MENKPMTLREASLSDMLCEIRRRGEQGVFIRFDKPNRVSVSGTPGLTKEKINDVISIMCLDMNPDIRAAVDFLNKRGDKTISDLRQNISDYEEFLDDVQDDESEP